MSNEMDKRNQGTAGTGEGAANNDGAKNGRQPNAFVRGFRWVKGKVVAGYEAVKDHPVTHALTALGGTALGGYVGYKLHETIVQLNAPEPVQQTNLIPEPETSDEEETNANAVEYVDIPGKTEEEGN